MKLTGTRPSLDLVYIIGSYPLLTTTFIDREIEVLRDWGIDLQVISIRRPIRRLSPEQEPLRSSVRYVLPLSLGRLAGAHLRFAVLRPRAYWGTLFRLVSLPHETGRGRLRTALHFGLAVFIAALVDSQYPARHLHAHFVDRAALVALVVGRLLDIPYSATAHANDIYVDPVLLPEKTSRAKFVATCTAYNQAYLSELLGPAAAGRVRRIYHGLDVDDYDPLPRSPGQRPRLLGVGQLKEKKGFEYLLKACRVLQERGLEFDCEIIGDGPLRNALQEIIEALSLTDRVNLAGALPHEEVVRRYRRADVFVLPAVTASDGDRDGIPNVILEAMAMELPVVSTSHSGIPEAVQDGRTGLLVPPGHVEALADALAILIEHGETRVRYGIAGRQRVGEVFDLEVNVKKLLREIVS